MGPPGMILLDTNVVSEAIKPEPHPSVRAWLDAQVAETLFLPSITIAELLFGIGVLPEGRRKTLLASRIDGLLDAFRRLKLPPGDYCAPKAESMEAMKSPAFLEKMAKGPVVIMTVAVAVPAGFI